MLPKLDKMVNQYKTTSKLTAEEIQKTDSEIRQAIDEVFNSDISSHVFGSTHPLTVLESGKLLVESFIEAFMPIVQKDIEQVKKSAGHRIDTSKAEKYLKDDAPFIPLDTPTEKVDLSKLSIEEKEKIFMEMFK